MSERSWELNGVQRGALVHLPQRAEESAPLVFVFHGHGGNARGTARAFAIHERWPEAIVVYPQGLKTPGRLTDPEGKRSGWQPGSGEQGDRDLAFFDAMLKSLCEELPVDLRRIHATGHSNGGGFTYLLWAQRGEHFASFAPSSATGIQTLRDVKLAPRPVLHVAGSKDRLVLFAWQEQTIQDLRKRGRCEEGRPWKQHADATLYPSPLGAPVVALIHPGGHRFLRSAPERMVEFFKEHPLPHKTREPAPSASPDPAERTPGQLR